MISFSPEKYQHQIITGSNMLENRFERDALYFDYSSAANPLLQKIITPIPYQTFSPSFFEGQSSDIMPLDISDKIECEGPATSPSLCANFVRIVKGTLQTSAQATSQIFYVYKGDGRTDACGQSILWSQGDFIVLPSHDYALHHCSETAALYWVHDAPLLRYLGVVPSAPRFQPTVYKHTKAEQKLKEVAIQATTSAANRVSVLLANKAFPQTRTVSQTLWAMYGLLPSGKSQLPHRHESVALDFVIDCKPGCYTLIGTELGVDGWIKNPHRENWIPGASFITPPGYWHSHHNESGADAHVLPIQDAGLQAFLRTLEIKFSHIEPDGSVHVTDLP
jgi:gentisate 1,2-dioxygenase